MILIGYVIYLVVTFFITVHVGLVLYRNGEVFLMDIFHAPAVEVRTYNRLLLLGYYLLNLGYASVALVLFDRVDTVSELIAELSRTTGTIIFTLALIHFFNMAACKALARNPSETFKSE